MSNCLCPCRAACACACNCHAFELLLLDLSCGIQLTLGFAVTNKSFYAVTRTDLSIRMIFILKNLRCETKYLHLETMVKFSFWEYAEEGKWSLLTFLCIPTGLNLTIQSTHYPHSYSAIRGNASIKSWLLDPMKDITFNKIFPPIGPCIGEVTPLMMNACLKLFFVILNV